MKNTHHVSALVPMRNSETTIIKTLKSIVKQNYVVQEIVVIDNASSDNSVSLVKQFSKHVNIPVKILTNGTNKGVGESYNIGAQKAKGTILLLMHSDGSLPTKNELAKLLLPLQDDRVVATYASSLMPITVWRQYNFWQQCHFSRAVGVKDPGFTGKFDAVRKDAFQKVKGFNAVDYGEDIGIGGEDADLYLRLSKVGKLIPTNATVHHLHYLGSGYAFSHWKYNRKLLAKTYGRLLRLHGSRLPLTRVGIGHRIPLGAVVFLVKPILAIVGLIGLVKPEMYLLLLAFSLVNHRQMYTNRNAKRGVQTILIPFIDLFFIYYETYWMFQAFLFKEHQDSDTIHSELLHP